MDGAARGASARAYVGVHLLGVRGLDHHALSIVLHHPSLPARDLVLAPDVEGRESVNPS